MFAGQAGNHHARVPELNNLGERIYRGIGVSPGVVRGRIVVLDGGQTERPTRRRVEPAGLPAELDRERVRVRIPVGSAPVPALREALRPGLH